jgi:thymidylate synthase ThyX
MNRIVSIAEKSKQYMATFTANVVRVIEGNKDFLIDLNRSQMINSKDALDKPLIHAKTGSSKLSKAYARRTGKTKPDLLLSGKFQDAMTLIMPNEKQYFIGSKDYKTTFLSENYGEIFGVSPKNQPKAQKVNDKLIVEDYKKSVFG